MGDTLIIRIHSLLLGHTAVIQIQCEKCYKGGSGSVLEEQRLEEFILTLDFTKGMSQGDSLGASGIQGPGTQASSSPG